MTHTSIIAYLIKIARHKIAIPRSRFAIALYQSKLQAIPAERFAIAIVQSNLRAIPAERFAIALSQGVNGNLTKALWESKKRSLRLIPKQC
ncbi:hypothetical protein BMF77_03037 [Dolichospermum sp. UHCC 0315A]|jgi:hypothetical protein|nr:hypothetical protein BMF77_03037 [Dolichospermum sp. UHCC 0315A]